MKPASLAVEELIHEYYRLVFHTIYGLTGDWEESQDLTQDTFQQALKAIDAARTASGSQFHAKAWLLRIALNTVQMQRRRRNIFRFLPFSSLQERRSGEDGEQQSDFSHEQAVPVQPAGYGAIAAGDPAELVAEQDAVQRTLARLPENLRVCLLLSIVGGLSMSEIASMLDLKEPAVRQRLSRARKLFQQAYTLESNEEVSDRTTSSRETPDMQEDDTHAYQNEKDQKTLSDRSQRFMLAPRPSITWRT